MVAQYNVRFMYRVENDIRPGSWMQVGVALLHPFPVRAFDLIRIRIAPNAKHLIMIVSQRGVHSVGSSKLTVHRTMPYAIQVLQVS